MMKKNTVMALALSVALGLPAAQAAGKGTQYVIAIGTVLSIFSFQGPWALGGSVTICSMLPLAIISWRHGTRWGLISAFMRDPEGYVIEIQEFLDPRWPFPDGRKPRAT